MNDDSNPELESFRRQWRAEVSAKTKPDDSNRHHKSAQPAKSKARRPSIIPQTTAGNLGKESHGEEHSDEDDGHLSPVGESNPVASSSSVEGADNFSKTAAVREPHSALEHYEKAVERELQGNLGDSLKLYRKAVRMDDRVDLKYKNKHFPPSHFASKPSSTNPSNAAPTVPNPAHQSLEGPPQSTNDLISSFSLLRIAAAEPPIEGAPAPPCPIADLPEEILIHILTDLALLDITAFVRLAQVCKRFAYIVAIEDQIWKRICLGHEVGFGGMYYTWQMEVTGEPLLDPLDEVLEITAPTTLAFDGVATTSTPSPLPISPTPVALGLPSVLPTPTPPLVLSPLYPTYAKMFRYRPRLRFDGVYISTVNYIRPGAATPSQTTWGAPVHIVTYYRYLRFFRDGAVLSLLTTHEPVEVVHPLLPSLFNTRAPASSPVHNVLKGRWKLGGEPEKEGEGGLDESALTVETEGFDPKYVYRMELQLKGQEKGRARLMWKGFWNWNRLTDDWGQFGLRNDKPFMFSKVKTYGRGARGRKSDVGNDHIEVLDTDQRRI